MNRPMANKRKWTRRQILRSGLAISAVGLAGGVVGCTSSKQATPSGRGRGPHVLVVGAGAFGGWTALHLLRKGARVTLVDAWGAGHSRASSGGDSRVIRHTYSDRIYVDFVIRSLAQWRENETLWQRKLYRQTGVLWLVQEDDAYEQSGVAHMKEAGVVHQVLEPGDVARRFPQINTDGVRWAIYEEDAGYLLARRACEAVREGFVSEGGEYRRARIEPGSIEDGSMAAVRTTDGESLVADRFVFACGPWLGKLFPEVVGERVRPTRQEVFYFGTAAGDARFVAPALPIWADHGETLWYGIPGSERRGFKVADDTQGPDFDPTSGERSPSEAGLKAAREYMEYRFPAMKGAPLLEARVCQYENSPDTHFIVDRHPRAANVWLVGGGSGHGFKHGPAMGQHVAERVLEQREVEPMFALGRFATAGVTR